MLHSNQGSVIGQNEGEVIDPRHEISTDAVTLLTSSLSLATTELGTRTKQNAWGRTQ